MEKDKLKYIHETATKLRVALEDIKKDLTASDENASFDIDEFIKNTKDIENTMIFHEIFDETKTYYA